MTEQVSGSVLLTHDVGLHARPSLKLTKLAKQFRSTVTLGLSESGPWIDAKSINKVMSAKVPKDTTLFFEASGDDASEAVAALTALVENDFENGGPANRTSAE